ncbi:hypothetical protein F383_34916 [Gossypium arboreum]|uniref:Uncharacterized protein n=1 Tax=Gossypium arboreum TaxID=29729 RepID=A0A0B0PT81_GOSAR|nr:hypothetical protein F383_34916 [Gossypium arboreum]
MFPCFNSRNSLRF